MSVDILGEYLVRISDKDARAFATTTTQFTAAVNKLEQNVSLWIERFKYIYNIIPKMALTAMQWRKLTFWNILQVQSYSIIW